MDNIKSIHFVGIKGVGMTSLAIIAKEAGVKVTGSDVEEEFITDNSRIIKRLRLISELCPKKAIHLKKA